MMLSWRRESNGIASAETLIIMGQTSSLFASKTAGEDLYVGMALLLIRALTM
jgi:hypothetical protein